ncbi:MAG: methyltransferase domain-containing protein [Streptosporangiales bacterium]|nr:methyltransferase domain-containing protein [Streptosporangiales bacterium]
MVPAAELAERWRRDLASWAIPEEITSAVEESPWTLPTRFFARRADQQLKGPDGPSYDRALETLPSGGTVLDVGSGAGAASLPLARWASSITAVDTSAGMLDALAERAIDLGIDVRRTVGRWPDVAGDVPPADVVVCHNVLYNVPDIEPFVLALTSHARRRVVVQLTARHPLTPLNPLWLRLHGLRRPDRPVAGDAVAVLMALGLRPQARTWMRSERPAFDSFDDLVEVTRRRLCLPPARAGELAAALRDLGVDPRHPQDPGSAARETVTVWWEGSVAERAAPLDAM